MYEVHPGNTQLLFTLFAFERAPTLKNRSCGVRLAFSFPLLDTNSATYFSVWGVQPCITVCARVLVYFLAPSVVLSFMCMSWQTPGAMCHVTSFALFDRTVYNIIEYIVKDDTHTTLIPTLLSLSQSTTNERDRNAVEPVASTPTL